MFNKLKDKLGGWIKMIFNKNSNIKDILKATVNEEHYRLMDVWKEIYSGYHKPWHNITYQTVNGNKQRTMHSLRMAKASTEKLSKIIFTERVLINIDDKAFGDFIHDTLNDNRFNKVFQGKLEQMFALGGLILKAVPKQQQDGSYKLSITYITPDAFIPIRYENGEVTEAAFPHVTKKNDKTYCLYEIHEWVYETIKETGVKVKVLQVRNELYEQLNELDDKIKRIPLDFLYPDLKDVVLIRGLKDPLFVYIKPNIANNFDLQSPLGISIYANALDTLYAIDQTFDSLIREFKLGKRKIIVPYAAIKTVIDPVDGSMHRYFDADDEAYQAFNFQDPDKQKIIDNTVALRVDEHTSAISALLNIYAMQTGFSAGSFTFDGASVKTATEIVSEQSATYHTKQVNEELIEEGLKRFINVMGQLGELYDLVTMPDDYEIEMFWDDTIVKDKYTDSDFFIKLVGNGLWSKKRAIMKIMDVTEKEADDILAEIAKEQATNNPNIESILGVGE